jgi:hypothetical protein
LRNAYPQAGAELLATPEPRPYFRGMRHAPFK